MNLQDLVDHVGEELFSRACKYAWATAEGTGTSREKSENAEWLNVEERTEIVDVPHELADLIWSSGTASPMQRVELAFDLYRRMPSYGTLMYVKHHFVEFDEDARDLFWREVRSLISEPDDRLADPLAYSLWCDYFEDRDTVEEAWRQLIASDELNRKGLERLLEASGPVPFRLKRPLLERLADDPEWHVFVYRSLLHGAFDIYGDIEINEARRLFRRLHLPDGIEGIEELKEKLGLSRDT